MKKETIISIILVVASIIISSILALRGLNIDVANPEHLSGALGRIIAWIIIPIIAGLVIALVVYIFSKKRTRERFFLIFSFFFLLTVLFVASGDFENKKTLKEINNENKSQELLSPYVSSSEGFQINFPTKPEIARSDFSSSGINGGMVLYISTKQFKDEEIIYYVITNNMEGLASLDENGIKSYFEQIPVLGLAEAGAKVTKIVSNIKNVYKNTKGVEYKYKLEADGETLYKKGIDFIENGKGYQVSIIYPSTLDNQINNIYSEFVSSFSLLSLISN